MNIAIVLAAGKSERLNDINVPKQLYLLNNVPLFMYSVLTFNNLEDIDEVYVVTNEECYERINQYLNLYHLEKVKGIILGGATRQESVYNALKKLEESGVKDDDIILIHDAARPLMDKFIVLDNIAGVKMYDAVTTAIKVKDTIIKGEDALDGFVDRNELYQAQTPQSFRFRIIKDAHDNAIKKNLMNMTDDSALVKENGQPVHIVKGTTANFKVTTIDDLKLLEMIVL
ncbi:MAG: 2-C-methyl-D-erythritol 4-phosphate cytidylyltransferase [Bacilli bacterium]|nr:2-C-methyl-D-erythritol 4-phosphate cytidylyltransferase [Bacilli bacterium]